MFQQQEVSCTAFPPSAAVLRNLPPTPIPAMVGGRSSMPITWLPV